MLLGIVGCSSPKVEYIYAPKLKTQSVYLSSSYFLYNLASLKEALFPNLESTNTYGANPYAIAGVPNLQHLSLKSTCFTKNVSFCNAFYDGKEINLIWLELTDEPNESFAIKKWNPTNAYLTDSSSLVNEGESYANNYEKFLDKFKTGIVDKLTDRTGLGALTISLNSTLVSQLSTDIKSLITSKNWNIASV